MPIFKNITQNNRCGFILQTVLGALIYFAAIAPVQAFPVTVIADTSPQSLATATATTKAVALQTSILSTGVQTRVQQALEYVRTAERWMKEVEMWTNSVMNQVKQFTSLKGILSFAEKQLGITEDTLKAVGEIGQVVKGIFTLKNNFMTLIRTRLDMIESLENRARRGIFDPQADLADLERYLNRAIAKSSRNIEITNEKIAQTDDKLELLNRQYKIIRSKRGVIQNEISQIKEQVKKETDLSKSSKQTVITDSGASATAADSGGRVSTSADAINTLTIRLGQLEAMDNDLEKQENEIIEKIQAIYTAYTEKFNKAYYTGAYWKKVSQGWEVFAQSKADQIESILDTTGTIDPKHAESIYVDKVLDLE